jgi:capsular polysaccharide export protein
VAWLVGSGAARLSGVVERRSFLLLQGPVGPFFRRLAAQLAARGHRVTRVNFNGGDLVQGPRTGALCFRGPPEAWPQAVVELAERCGVGDLVLFGDCRPRHRIAIRALQPLGVRVHVLEEGYFRPDWITCERDGVNANSRLPRDPAFYLDAVHRMANRGRESVAVGPSVAALIRATAGYYAGAALLAPLFPRHRSHRPCSPWRELGWWLSRAPGLRARRRIAALRQAALLAGRRPFFVLALQLEADSQIRRHSGFSGMSEVIAFAVHSFARSAPDDAILVVKNHPLDCGRIDYERVVANRAAAAGIGPRTLYLDGGDLPALLGQALGLVVVNSTSGLSGLHRGLPTVVLGRALYDIPGLTHDAGGTQEDRLDRFWRSPEPPDGELYRAFRRVVMERTQINGGFYSERGLALAVPATAARLEAA